MAPDNELQVLVCSANLGNAQPDTASLEHWIPADGRCLDVLQLPPKYPLKPSPDGTDPAPFNEKDYSDFDQFDIIVLGMQEATFDPPVSSSKSSPYRTGSTEFIKIDTEHSRVRVKIPVVSPIVSKSVQKTVRGVSALTANRDYTKRTTQLFDIDMTDWSGGTEVLHKLLGARLPSYKRLVSFQRGEMRLEIFVHVGQLVRVDVVKVSAQNTGRAGLANKGGIVAELLIDKRTRLGFLTAHLEAHEGLQKYQHRVSTIGDILSGTREKLHDVSLSSHYCFVMGDLNFRTELPQEEYESEEDHKAKVRKMVEDKDWDGLNQIDELHRALRNKDCLVGFQTMQCNFPPTFKMERAPGYAYIDKRRPSYTDRVLWKTGHLLTGGIRPLVYEPIDNFASSDHKPVRAAFAVDLNKPLKMRPRMARTKTISRRINRKRNAKSKTMVAHRNKLYLFVSQIEAEVDGKTSNSSVRPSSRVAPSPYLMLVSFPPEAIKAEVRWWSKLKSKIGIGHTHSIKNPDGSKVRTAFGWPRTSLKHSTYEPNWGNEEMNCLVSTHANDGSPIDLTGAMLRLTLMDDNVKTEDPVLGSFSFNLANLLRKCVGPDGDASAHATPPGSRQSMAGHRSGSLGRSRFASSLARRSSVFNVFRRSSPFGNPEVQDSKDEDSDNDEIVSATVDEPLFKNGRQVGRIKCTIEAWWMNEDTARTATVVPRVTGSEENMDGTHQRSLLAPRHNDRYKRGSSGKRGSGGVQRNTADRSDALRESH